MVRGRQKVALVAALMGAVVAAASCVPVEPLDPSLSVYVLTRAEPAKLSITRDGGDVVVAAVPGQETSPIRLAVTSVDAVPVLDAETCATWRTATGSHLHQEGAFFRIRADRGVVRGVSVTKNVWGNAYYTFNVHTWDTSVVGTEAVMRGQFNLEPTFATGPAPLVKAFPWRMCARVVGNRLSFVVWPLAELRPAWGDPRYGGTTTIPDEYVYPGLAGIYVGHVAPGSSVRYSDIVTGPPGIGDPTTTTTTTSTTTTSTSASTTPTTTAPSTTAPPTSMSSAPTRPSTSGTPATGARTEPGERL